MAQQTYPNVEHVIIDGGSRDKTVELANSLIRSGGIVRSESDKGIYDAMNKGLRLATGDIIGFLNADDVYADNDLLRRVVEMMEQTSLDALFGDVEFFKSEVPEKAHRRYRSNRFRPDRIGWGWMPAHPTLFLRRRVFDEFGCFRENYKIAGDFELIARIFKSNTLVYRYVPQVLVRMRIGGVSTGGWRNTIRLNKEVLRACRENGISSNWIKLLSKYPAKLFEFFLK